MLSSLALLAAVPAAADTIAWVKTSQGDGTRLTPQAALPFQNGGGSKLNPNNTLVVDTSATLQPILGFGGALTESSASIFEKLSPATQEEFMELYYGETGIGYTFARTHIGSCDFSLKPYTYQSQKDDFNMSTFTMEHDEETLIPFIKRVKSKIAASQHSLRLVSSPWTPPAWLKTCGERFCPLVCTLKKETEGSPYRTAYALYISKYLDGMAAAGVKPWAITPQNEPQACKSLMESMDLNADEERDFLSGQLGPKLRKDHPDVKILGFDHNKDKVAEYAATLLDPNSSTTSAAFVDGIAFHWYSSHDYFEHLEEVHTNFPGTMLLATEATEGKDIGHYDHDQSWEKGEHYGHVILGDLNHWAQGWIDWNVLLDLKGGPTHPGPQECEGLIKCGDDAMIIAGTTYANSTGGVTELYPQVFYYYMGHFSKFIKPDSHRVGLTNPLDKSGNGGDSKGKADGSLEALAATTPDGKTVVVVMNRNDDPITFSLQDKASGRSTQAPITIAAHSIHTYTY